MKISFITTVFNEEKTARQFFQSLNEQTKQPDEIIIVDGGSTDKTLSKISNFKFLISKKHIKILKKRGNRSVGRNEAIKNATGDIIVCSDAGNILDKDWIKNIIKPFKDKSIDVVSGYYKGMAKNIFQKCLIPYVLVMPDKADPDNFLPATRSVAFTKKIWEKVGGFDERLSHNEDYAFAQKLKEKKAKIVFAKDAIVNWIPRTNFKEAFTMFWRFAFGDAESGILRTNVLLLFVRYFLGFYFIFLSFLYKSFAPFVILCVAFIAYIFWSIKKNYHYVNQKKARVILPLLQFTADTAVLSGTIVGVLRKVVHYNYLSYIKQNKFLFFILALYIFITLLTLRWGIPNQNHPFPYHMDEWHQLQAVANTFRYGTPNTEGSANGTMFHFLLSGFYLIPFTVFQVIDPFALQIENWFMRERIFYILRLQTILFGTLSIIVLYTIAGLLRVSKKLSITLFVFTPVWLLLSNYFKYDIALMFWILLSLLFFLRFAHQPNNYNFLLAAIPSSLAFTVKVSAIPLFFSYVISYFLFIPVKKRNYKYFFASLGIFLSVVVFFGIPDTLFGKGNIVEYLYDNLIRGPGTITNLQVGVNQYIYLFFNHMSLIFGHGLFALSIISVVTWLYIVGRIGFKKFFKDYRIVLFIFITFLLFVFSLLKLGIQASGNRSLVLLPFFVLISVLALQQVQKIKKIKLLVISVITVCLFIQVYESFAWTYIKVVKNPQEIASEWITTNVKQGRTIGLENTPIYQGIPDILQKEFYFHQYKVGQRFQYTYQIIDAKTQSLPSVIVLTNSEVNKKLFKHSPQKELLSIIEQKRYKKIAVFSPDTRFIKPFVSDIDYYFSGLNASPYTITIFEKK